MGVEYDLISDRTGEGYELGKGPWGGGDLSAALRSVDPAAGIAALMVEHGFGVDYAAEVACEVAAFAAAHPDWRIVDDCSGDETVVDDEECAELLADGWQTDDFPLYKKVGSRYRETVATPPAVLPQGSTPPAEA